MRLSGSASVSMASTGASSADLVQHARESIDVRLGARLGDADEKRVVHARIVPAERIAGMDASRSSLCDDVTRGTSEANGKLLECCRVRKQELTSDVVARIRAE